MHDDDMNGKAHPVPSRRRPRNEDAASPRLKARLYSALIHAQQESGPLESLAGSQANGYELCAFEQLLQITPVAGRWSTFFFCHTCHARVLAERLERVPLPWAHCPYKNFQRS